MTPPRFTHSKGEHYGHNETKNSREDEDWSGEDPIAVCGFSLKFPQEASTEEAFWTMITEKRSAMTEYPRDRLNIDAFHHASRPNALRTRGAHFIDEDLGLFDAGFFSISPTEAAAMDPMQRILLETTVHAFESGGIRIQDVRKSRTSVHTGCFTNDYLQLMLKDSERLPPYAAIGASQSMLANRLSWFFDLRGPSVNLDSACSSSAMGIDISCQLLRSGTTDMGIVAGCNVLLDPDYSTILSDMQMLSPDGRSYAFDHRANGYSRGEGVAVVVLKRLSDALRANDTVRAVIRASATNQDGRTSGITQPDSGAQARLIRETYLRAGLSMAHTRFFEAHGTGTRVGDPIEITAIAECFRPHRQESDPLYVGSVKTNIGHLEGASGVAGLLKAILVVESGIIPPNANYESLNRRLASYNHTISLPLECIPWPPCSIRRASVNSFGYGGTNCHVVIDDAYSYLTRRNLRGNHCTVVNTGEREFDISSKVSDRPHHCTFQGLPPATSTGLHTLLVWSATTEKSTRDLVSAWERYCSTIQKPITTSLLPNIAYTLDSRRNSMQWGSFAVLSSATHLQNLTEAISRPVERPKQAPHVAFVFTGQGAQWYAMGRELFLYPVFAKGIQYSQSMLETLGASWSIKDELFRDERETMVNHPSIAQCLTSLIQMGLVDLLSSFDVRPRAVVGHSMGEIAAAYCAGLLNRDSALRITYHRGFFTAKIPMRSSYTGAMIAVGLSEQQLATYLDNINLETKNHDGNLMISCINSPCNSTISGEQSRVEKLKVALDAKGIFNRKLHVPVAYHSPQMEHIVHECLHHFGKLLPGTQNNDIKMISSVTGELLTRERACDGSYWVANLMSPVLFAQAMKRLCKHPVQPLRQKLDGSHRGIIAVNHVVEIGPHAALRLPIQEILDSLPHGDEITYLSALYRKESASASLLRMLGILHCRGLPVSLRRVNDPNTSTEDCRICLVDAPKYPFDHSTKYWAESPLVRNYRMRPHGYSELLGSPSRDWNPLAPQWRCCVITSNMPWLLEHGVHGTNIYPAAAMIVMVTQGILQLLEGHEQVAALTLRDVRCETAIAVSPGSDGLETRLQLRPKNSLKHRASTLASQWTFSVYSVSNGHWSENCCGTIQAEYVSTELTAGGHHESWNYKRLFDLHSGDCNPELTPSTLYDTFNQHGHQYGPTFQGITKVRYGQNKTVVADVSLANPLNQSTCNQGRPFIIHPATLDAFFQASLATLSHGGSTIPTQVISRVKKLWISVEGLAPSQEVIHVSAKVERNAHKSKMYSAFALDKENSVKLVLEGLETTVIVPPDPTEPNCKSRQFWYHMKTGVNVNLLSGQKLLVWLDSECGNDVQGPDQFFRDLRRYLAYTISKIKSQIDASGIDTNRPHLQRYSDWMEWHIAKSIGDYREEDVIEFRTRLGENGFLGEFFLRVADCALAVLQGNTDMVQVLFGNDSLAERFYEQQLSGSLYYRKLRTYLEGVCFVSPNLDYLEVGAGTGSFTKHMLDALSSSGQGRLNRYCFTDISSAFFDRARQRFAEHVHKMQFALLDIDEDPIVQGFEEQSYDIIAASNVLHVTKDLDLALQRLRRVLKPGGKLILHEYIRPETIDVGFVFGLLPGWWPTTDDNRPMSPLVTEKRWDELLRRNGFSGADFILRDFSDEDSHLMSIICATATYPKPDTMLPEVAIAIQSSSALQRDTANILLRKLSSHGFPKVWIIDISKTFSDMASPGVMITLFDLEYAILFQMTEAMFDTIKRLLHIFSKVLWVSGGGGQTVDPSHGMIDGFAKVFRVENINSKLVTLALEPCNDACAIQLDLIIPALEQLVGSSMLQHPDDHLVVTNGLPSVARISEDAPLTNTMSNRQSRETQVLIPVQDAKPFRVAFEPERARRCPCVIQDSHEIETLEPGELEIDVHTADLSSIESSYSPQVYPALTHARGFAGIVIRVGDSCGFLPGDRVCAYSTETLRSTCRAKQDMVARVPDSMNFEKVSALVQDYVLANYILEEARIRQDDDVIVRGAHSTFSEAIIYLLAKKCSTVIALVTTEQDQLNIESAFTDVHCLKEELLNQNCSSRLPAIVSTVIDLTIANVTDLKEHISQFGQYFKIVAHGGSDSATMMSNDLPSTIGFKIIDIVEVLKHQFGRLSMPFVEFPVTRNGLGRKMVKSVTLSELSGMDVTSMPTDSDERLVVRIDNTDQIPVYRRLEAKQLFDPNSSYVIAGGLGDLGRSVADWMVKHGVRNLIILSRSGPRTETAQNFVRKLEQCEARVCTPICDISDRSALVRTLHQLRHMPSVKGCVQATGALKDISYHKMSFDDWEIATKPKVRGSLNLHELLPKGMDFFILVSSITGIMGQATQINYAAGNTYQDALARYRLSIGEKAISLDLGILLTGGLLSQNQGLSRRLHAEGIYAPLSESQILTLFEHICGSQLNTDPVPSQIITGIISPSQQNRRATNFPMAFLQPFWSHTLVIRGGLKSQQSHPEDTSPGLAKAGSFAEQSEMAANALASQFCSLSLTPRARIKLGEPLHTVGVDSLSAVYLRNWIMKQFGVDVPVFDILGDSSIMALGSIIAQEWSKVQGKRLN